MLGAIAGDIIGSPYEFNRIKTTSFPLFSPKSRFTDDTVATVAIADVILHGGSYADTLQDYYARYSDAGWGAMFSCWAGSRDHGPYNSFGNGSAMRVSPVGFAFDTLEQVCSEAQRSAEITHNHAEGIKGARATAACIYLARSGRSKQEIKNYITRTFGYDLSRTLDAIRPTYTFNGTCQGTVPEAIMAWMESTDYEDAVRKAVSLGGDSDTLACITGGIAEAFYGGVPREIGEQAMSLLDEALRAIIEEFREKYHLK